MSTRKDPVENAYRADKIAGRRIILDGKIKIAAAKTKLFRNRYRTSSSKDKNINNRIKLCCMPKIMKDLKEHSRKVFAKYCMQNKHETYFKQCEPLRFSQKFNILWKKFQRTRAV